MRVVLLLGLLASPTILFAQQTRNDRLAAAQRAYFDDLEPERARTLLRDALNPALGPADTGWARGVQLMAQILFEEGNQDHAAVWLRWAFRLAPGFRIDTVTFLPEVVQAARAARDAAAAPSPGDPVTRTTWEWAAPGVSAGQGALRVLGPGLRTPLNVGVQGRGVVQGGQALALPPGTHQIQAAAEGYVAAQLSREVLPGITTVLEFNLVAASTGVLAAGVRDAAFRQIVPVTARRFQTQPVCATGAYVGRNGLVLTSYEAIRGAEAVEAGGSTEIRVAAWDVARNLAVLQLPVVRADSMSPAQIAVGGQFVWALGMRDCRTAAETRARVAGIAGPTVDLADSIGAGERAGPLIDGEGRLVGLLSAPRRAASLAAIQELLATARRNVGTPQAIAVAEVALRERHAYGSVVITSDATGVTARIAPLETWQWPGLAWSGSLPYTFAGPTGRYQLEVTVPGQQPRQLEFTVRAGATERFPVASRALAAEERQVGGAPPRRGKGFPWPIALIGAGGVGAAVFLLLPKGGGPGGETGGITITLPVH